MVITTRQLKILALLDISASKARGEGWTTKSIAEKLEPWKPYDPKNTTMRQSVTTLVRHGFARCCGVKREYGPGFGKKRYTITDKGREYLETQRKAIGA